MSNTDFIDDDLIQRREAVREVTIGPGGRAADAPPDLPRAEAVPTGDLNLTPLARRKEEINSQVASKMDELERLRAKQEGLEREKSHLEHLRSNQEKYEAGKREMLDHLEKSLVALERETIALNQRLALVTETESRFKAMASEIRDIREDAWPADSAALRDALSKALVIIDSTRKEYNKACARIEALQESQPAGGVRPMMPAEAAESGSAPRRFADCVKMGFAFSLPVVIVLIVLIGVLVARLL